MTQGITQERESLWQNPELWSKDINSLLQPYSICIKYALHINDALSKLRQCDVHVT